MGGQSFNSETQSSLTAPWQTSDSALQSILGKPPRSFQNSLPLRPLWKELPWHIEHPGWFALLAGTLVTAALWLLSGGS